MAKREPVPQSDVLGWLAANYPQLHEVAEIERAWVWLPWDGRGEDNKPIREALKAFGFKFAFKGHQLPSGKRGTWGHCCTRPMPFRRHSKRNGGPANRNNDNNQASEAGFPEDLEAEALAFINS